MANLYQYADITGRVEPLLGIADTDSNYTLTHAVLLDLNEAAGRLINAKAHRIFALISETRTFDAPAGTVLPVVDLQPDPAPVVTLNGQPLTAGTDYLLQPETLTGLTPAHSGLARIENGWVRRWGYRPRQTSIASVPVSRWSEDYAAWGAPAAPYAAYSPTPSEGIITITGTWGYSATVPVDIQLLAERIVARTWHQRVRQYADQGAHPDGTAAAPPRPIWTVDDDVALLPYVYTGAA